MKISYKVASILAFNSLVLICYQLMLRHFVSLILRH